MAITNIAVNFTPCVPGPVGGYNIEYRVIGDTLYIDAGNFMSSPANISVSYPDGTEFEGIVHSPCGDVIWSTVPTVGVSITADNGLTMSTPTNVQLGGTLLHATTIDTDHFTLFITGPNVSLGGEGPVLQVNATDADGVAILAISDGVAAVQAQTTIAGGTAFWANISGAGTGLLVEAPDAGNIGVNVQSTDGLPLNLSGYFASTAVVERLAYLSRGTSGTSVDGVGLSIDFDIQSDTPGVGISNQIITKLTDSAIATATSELSITGMDNAVLQNIFALAGNGEGRLHKYGVGTFADTPVYGLGVLADGTIVEYDPGTGSGGGSGMFRFAYITEDDTAGEDRVFLLGTDFQIRFLGSVPGSTKDSIFKVVNAADEGTAIYGVASGADSIAIRGESADVAGSFVSTGATVDSHAIVTSAVDGTGAFISSTNNKGAYIQTSSGSYAIESRTITSIDNNLEHPNLLLKALSLTPPVADGFGQSIDFETNTTDLATTRISNQIKSIWVTADDTTGQSVMILTGVTAGALQDVVYIIGDGIIMLPLGLNDYVDDTAAAAGSPVIPVGGLYRNGSQMMIRVT